jgi:hypothetical protein
MCGRYRASASGGDIERLWILEKAYDIWFEGRKNAGLVDWLPRLANVSW